MPRGIAFAPGIVRALRNDAKQRTRSPLDFTTAQLLDAFAGTGALGETRAPILVAWGAPQDEDGTRRLDPQWLVSLAESPEDGCVEVGRLYGAPGSLFYVAEYFATEWIPPGGEVPRAGLEYWADWERAERDGVWGWVRDERPGRDGGEFRPGTMPWKVPKEMTPELARYWVRTRGLTIERLHDITDEEARLEGVTPNPGETYRAAFLRRWDEFYGDDSRFRVGADPWVVVLSIAFERDRLAGEVAREWGY